MPKLCQTEGCNNPVFGGGYCKFHQLLRKDKKPKTPKKQKTIRKVSNKQSRLIKEYLKEREIYLKKHPLCKANLTDCTKIATDVHHTKGRGVWLLETISWLPVCRTCHQWIETHPEEARKLYFSQLRLT